MKNIIILAYIISLSFIFSSCSVYMASQQPGKVNTKLFKAGTSRSLLLAEIGLPVSSEIRKDGKKYEIFSFVQGYGAGAKAGRAVFHGIADIATLGLWEIIGTPTEGTFDGKNIAYEVRYDQDLIVDQVIILKRK